MEGEETNQDQETNPKSLESLPIPDQQQVNGNLRQENDIVMSHEEQKEQDAVEIREDNEEVFEEEVHLHEEDLGVQTPEPQSPLSEVHQVNGVEARQQSEEEDLPDAREETTPREAEATPPPAVDPDVHEEETGGNTPEQPPPYEAHQVEEDTSDSDEEESSSVQEQPPPSEAHQVEKDTNDSDGEEPSPSEMGQEYKGKTGERNQEERSSTQEETPLVDPPIEIGLVVHEEQRGSATPEQSPPPEAFQENQEGPGNRNEEEPLVVQEESSPPIVRKEPPKIATPPPEVHVEETGHRSNNKTLVLRLKTPSSDPSPSVQEKNDPKRAAKAPPEVHVEEIELSNQGETAVVRAGASSVTPALKSQEETDPKRAARATSPPEVRVEQADHPKEESPPVVRKETHARGSHATRFPTAGNRSTPSPPVEVMVTHPKEVGGSSNEEQRRREERATSSAETHPKQHQYSSSSSFTSSFYSSLPSQDRERRETFPQESVANLKMIFLWKDTSAEYIAKGEFDAAYGIMDGRNRLEPALKNAVFLLNYCVTLFATNRMREYASEREKIMRLIMQKCRPSSKEMLSLAGKLAKDKQYFASLIMFEITLDMFFDATSPYTSIAFTERCMQGMKNAVSNAVEDEELLKYYVTRNFLPKMHSMKEAVERLNGVNPRFKCIKLGWITHCIEVCDSNDRSRIALLRRATDAMRDTLRDVAVNKYQIYGTLLNNLGTLYMQNGARDQAVDCYFRASECFNQAEDFETDEKRERYIRDVGRAVRAALGELTDQDLRDASKVAV